MRLGACMYSGTSPNILEKRHLWNEDTLLCSIVFEDCSTSGTMMAAMLAVVTGDLTGEVVNTSA